MDREKCHKEAEELLQKHVAGELVNVEDSKLLAAALLIAMKTSKEHMEAADVLAKTTKGQVLWMKWLTFILILVGIADIVIMRLYMNK